MHDFSNLRPGKDYFIDLHGDVAWVTVHAPEVNQDDLILLTANGKQTMFKVEFLSRYADPHGLWVGQLVRFPRNGDLVG